MDVAERLWLEQPDRVLNMAQVAAAAGLAKGTVYLYFRSKEALLLAVHERHLMAFFSAVIVCATQDRVMTFDDMVALTRRYIVDVPAFLPLANLCLGWMERDIDAEDSRAFNQRLATSLTQVAASLRRHFAIVDVERGVTLLMQSYALIIGLWQLLAQRPVDRSTRAEPGCVPWALDYFTVLDAALRALWRGSLAVAPEPRS